MRQVCAVIIWTVVALPSGCALRTVPASATSMSSPVRVGSADSVDTHIEKVRHLSARASAKPAAPQNIETQDQELAAVLQELAVHPTGELHRQVADRYRALRVPDMAYRHFNRAIALDSRDGAAYDGLARVWRDWGFPSLALGDAHRAVFFAPSSAAAHNTIGTVLQALGQHQGARSAYARAAQLEPNAAYALSNLCYLSFLHGQFDAAVSSCGAALAVDPSFAPARHNLALAHAGAGRLELAGALFLTASERDIGFFNIGIVHMANRNYSLAAAAFDAASRANPRMNIARERASQARHLGHSAVRVGSGAPK